MEGYVGGTKQVVTCPLPAELAASVDLPQSPLLRFPISSPSCALFIDLGPIQLGIVKELMCVEVFVVVVVRGGAIVLFDGGGVSCDGK
ncbi:hypothetical protein ACP70R_026357 [Stipagrostis hirtigluma subsp. patula]